MRGLKGKFLLPFILFAFIISIYADEGLWLFNNVPVDHIKKKYNFTVMPNWINHLMLSCAKIGGSASFVSPDGLVITNHHVGVEAIQNLSTKKNDLIKNGFYAKTKEEELKCSGLEIRVLQGIEDVTSNVNRARKAGMTVSGESEAIEKVISDIEKEYSNRTGLKCSVVKLYSGGMYHLYKYKIFDDVRLVFAPEQQIAFFGGDPDNYGYPRYCLDVSFFRVYEKGKPLKTDHYLKWSREGLKEGDLVFASGNPSTTSRLLTFSQLEFLRDVSYPFMITKYEGLRDCLTEFSDNGPEEARIAFQRLWGAENEIKCFKGQLSGLLDENLMAQKAKSEKEIRDAIKKNTELDRKYGKAWDEMTEAKRRYTAFYKPYAFFVTGEGFDTTYFHIAQDLVRLFSEKDKSLVQLLQKRILSSRPIYDEFEIACFTQSLTWLKTELGIHEKVKQLFGARSAKQVARELILRTKLKDIQIRKKYIEEGAEKIYQSDDPMIKLALLIDPIRKELRDRYKKEVQSVEFKNGALIARALFELKGTSIPPDATRTLRLSFGIVKGYMENGKKIPFQTTFKGLYELSEKQGNKFPYNLPSGFIKEKSKIDLSIPLNFVATCDSSGGNSGSPLVNKNGEFIGILFDGNKQSLPNRFLYSDTQSRSVMVNSQGIIEALLKVYKAKPLVDELLGRK